jgi:hypothetical protein
VCVTDALHLWERRNFSVVIWEYVSSDCIGWSVLLQMVR